MPVTKIVSLRNSGYLLRQRTSTSVSSEQYVHCVASMAWRIPFFVTSAEMVYIPSLCDASALFCYAMVYNLFTFENSINSFDKNTVSSSFVTEWDNSFFSGTFAIFVVFVL